MKQLPIRETLELSFREFFQWYFEVPTGHVFDASFYRHGSGNQLGEGMNFQNRLDAFKYECETQGIFMVETDEGCESIPTQICVDEIFPVIDSAETTKFELRGDEYCFHLPSGREMQMGCQVPYTADWREHLR